MKNTTTDLVRGIASLRGSVSRREAIARLGAGFGGLALGALLGESESFAADSPVQTMHDVRPKSPHHVPRARAVIQLFMHGGPSQVDLLDPKPELTKYGGKTISETPHKGVLDSPFVKKNVVQFTAAERKLMMQVLPLQVGFQKRGQSGIEISDWWPHVGNIADK
ncbi:MAG TPA: DUF1501 domain-containing protein, partial [Pirellulaceae bacterium]|nr:DUF1501 domain-containing protein [Pirellulaceae bacterium]